MVWRALSADLDSDALIPCWIVDIRKIMYTTVFYWFSTKMKQPKCEADAASVEAKCFLTSFVSVFHSVSPFVYPSAVKPNCLLFCCCRTTSMCLFFLIYQQYERRKILWVLIYLPLRSINTLYRVFIFGHVDSWPSSIITQRSGASLKNNAIWEKDPCEENRHY